VQAHRMKVTVPEERHLEIRLPQEFPAGPAEIIVLAGPEEAADQASGDLLAALETLRSLELTEEEERVLDEFKDFRQLLQQAGALAQDESLPLLRQKIYRARRRPEVDEASSDCGVSSIPTP
jgi:hypothetical protein